MPILVAEKTGVLETAQCRVPAHDGTFHPVLRWHAFLVELLGQASNPALHFHIDVLDAPDPPPSVLGLKDLEYHIRSLCVAVAAAVADASLVRKARVSDAKDEFAKVQPSSIVVAASLIVGSVSRVG